MALIHAYTPAEFHALPQEQRIYILNDNGRSELRLTETLELRYLSENGAYHELIEHRAFSISEQGADSFEGLQDWAFAEWCAAHPECFESDAS